MSSKREEEEAAFGRLKEAYSGYDVSLSCWYRSWADKPTYYVTASALASNICFNFATVDEAVNDFIIRKEDLIKANMEKQKMEDQKEE